MMPPMMNPGDLRGLSDRGAQVMWGLMAVQLIAVVGLVIAVLFFL